MIYKGDLHIHADPESLGQAVAARWEGLARKAVAKRGAFHVALAGGSTPRTLYRLLATPRWREALDWRKTHIYFGDERCVPPEHPDSNFRMAREDLLAHVDVLPQQTHRIEAERDPVSASRDYAAILAEKLPREERLGSPGRFDLLLLGLGPDGHIASLFPGTAILDVTDQWVAAVFVEKLQALRISLTYPVLNAARHTVMMVAGENKAGILQAISGPREHRDTLYPVERLRPTGRLEWFVDSAAATGIAGR